MIWRLVFAVSIFFLLTVITQVGGIVFLLSIPLFVFINKKISNPALLMAIKASVFIVLYLIFTFVLIPHIAAFFGRVPLPIYASNNLQPLNFTTCLLNRHYVKPKLKGSIMEVCKNLGQQYPNTVINYLDANFPFFDKFPLLPHLSHNDGKKLDLAFCYRDKATGKITKLHPSWIGYGACEEPSVKEFNMPNVCKQKGNWQYSFLKNLVSQKNKDQYIFDKVRTKALIISLTDIPAVEKIFIEPHLKLRLGLINNKIRFHGCQAVRHDDHIHVQLE